MSKNLTEAENAAMGAFGGWLDVTLFQWTNYIKNASQQGLPLTTDLRVLYRGYIANVCNNSIGIMFQFVINGALKKAITGAEDRDLYDGEKIGAGFAAGFMSGVICGPMELAMIQQQRKGGSLPSTVKTLVSAGPSTMLRGSLMTCWREGIYTSGFLGIVPVLRQNLVISFPDSIGSSEAKARTVASLIGGTVCCYLSHPADTIKTCLQGDIEKTKFGHARQTSMVLRGEGGVTALWRGAPWRLIRQVAGVFLLDMVAVEVSPLFFPHRFK